MELPVPRHWLDCTLPLQVYPPSSGDSYSRDAAAYPSAKTPSSAYPSPFYVAGAWGSLGGLCGARVSSHNPPLHRWQPAPIS
jgi:hypothetical protein